MIVAGFELVLLPLLLVAVPVVLVIPIDKCVGSRNRSGNSNKCVVSSLQFSIKRLFCFTQQTEIWRLWAMVMVKLVGRTIGRQIEPLNES